jgi:XTP/dITP diphosphohydrolase
MSIPDKPHKELVLASGNRGKIDEFQQLLGKLGWRIRPQSEFATIEVEETGLSFIENAILKARNAAAYSGLPALADDSGLEVDALKGAPGIYSARFAGEFANDSDNNQKLLEKLEGVSAEERGARFHCVLAFMRNENDPTPLICEGVWEGLILTSPRGDNGFGYDPLFYIPELNCCSAELAPLQKNKLSHRAKAMTMLLDTLCS